MITASEFHPKECNLFVYSSSKVIRIFPRPWINFDFTSGNNSVVRFAPICDIWLNLIEINFQGTIRLCDMRQSALCDSHSKMFEEPEDPTNRSFFSEIISSISDVKFSNSGRYMISRWGWFLFPSETWFKFNLTLGSFQGLSVGQSVGLAHGVKAHRDLHRPRVPPLQALQPLWKRLHLWQVWGW